MKRLLFVPVLLISLSISAQFNTKGLLTSNIPVEEDEVPFYKRFNFEVLGRQNVEILSTNEIVQARSQVGFGASLIYWYYPDLHPETRIGYRVVDLSNIDSIGTKKYQNLYFMMGGRFLPCDQDFLFEGNQLRLTFAALGGISIRGASLADQLAFDMLLSAGLAYSFQRRYYTSFVMLEFQYSPLGSDAVGGIYLPPSYTFCLSFVL
jgi:hypothetical protein